MRSPWICCRIFCRCVRSHLQLICVILYIKPFLCQALANRREVPFSRGGAAPLTVTGMEYWTNTMNQLANAPWQKSMCIDIARVLREIPLANDLLYTFVAKIASHFREMDIQMLPPLVYQTLLLCNRKEPAVKRLLLRAIVAVFDVFDRDIDTTGVSADQLRNIEGTIILQVNFAVKQDQKLGKE